MILSDISQRRIVVDSVDEVNRISNISRDEEVLFNYYEIDKDIYLITLTNTRAGDFHSTNGITMPGLAMFDIMEIKEKKKKMYYLRNLKE